MTQLTYIALQNKGHLKNTQGRKIQQVTQSYKHIVTKKDLNINSYIKVNLIINSVSHITI